MKSIIMAIQQKILICKPYNLVSELPALTDQKLKSGLLHLA